MHAQMQMEKCRKVVLEGVEEDTTSIRLGEDCQHIMLACCVLVLQQSWGAMLLKGN